MSSIPWRALAHLPYCIGIDAQAARRIGMSVALGIDFGGTKVLAGVVNLETGEVLATAKKRTNAGDDAGQLMDRLYAVGADALEKSGVKPGDIEGIGVGLAGQIDVARGILLGAPNLSQSTVDLPMADLLTSHFGVPARLRNDVQVAALGEGAFGAGKGHSEFVCVFVGTGIGGALVRDGLIVPGAAGACGEIGHIVIHANGRICGCGGRGHLEAYASRTAITKALLGELKRGRKSIVSDLIGNVSESDPGGTAIRSGVLAKAISAEDELAFDIVYEAGRYLGYGLASVINLLNPARIILGGGVIEAVQQLFSFAVRTAQREALPTSANSVEIVQAGLGDYAGVVGAALLNAPAPSAKLL
jgi:glucokinase